MTETQAPVGRRHARLPHRLEVGLLVIALVCFVAAVVIGFVPVDNPGVQACHTPFLFAWHTSNDVVLPALGSPDAPADLEQLRAQAPCHERVDDRLIVVGLLVVATVVAGLAGAAIGLADDRADYRAEPRFESLLRERPAGSPNDPWDRPVVPRADLGVRLPELEWREVRVVIGLGVGAAVVLAWLAGFGRVARIFGHLQLGWLAAAVVLVVATYGVAAAGLLAATDTTDTTDGRRRPLGPVLGTAVASSFTGRLLPEYGAAGLAVHQLVRAGVDRARALRQVALVDAVAVPVHGLLTLVVLVAAAGGVARGGMALRADWLVWAFVIVMVLIGLIDAPRRYRTLVVAPTSQSYRDLAELTRVPLRLAALIGSALVLAVLNACVLVAAAHAVGASPPGGAALLVGLVLAVVVVAAPVPDGAGVVEALAVVGLVWAGVGAPAAVAAMVVTRVLGFWLPMLPGRLVLGRLQRDGTI